MFKKTLVFGLAAAQYTSDIETGNVCFGYDTCLSGCCLRNILPAFDYFYPNEAFKKYTQEDIDAIAQDMKTLKTTGIKSEKDGVTHYTSVDGTTYVDVPSYWLEYTPAFFETLDTRGTEQRYDTPQDYEINYGSIVCQSNVTMCEGVPDPTDLSNIGDFDDALAAANAIGVGLIAFFIIFPTIFVCIICVCLCKCNKLLCFRDKEVEAAPQAQEAQKDAPSMVGQGGVPPPMGHPGMMGPPPVGFHPGAMPMAGGVTHHQSSSTTTTTTSHSGMMR
jgi:hypothetical protein